MIIGINCPCIKGITVRVSAGVKFAGVYFNIKKVISVKYTFTFDEISMDTDCRGSTSCQLTSTTVSRIKIGTILNNSFAVVNRLIWEMKQNSIRITVGVIWLQQFVGLPTRCSILKKK